MTGRRGGLGRGLSALIPAEDGGGLRDLPVTAIVPNPRQPRGVFDEHELTELADSIREVGLLQPVVVRQRDEDQDRYELIAGERRVRAAKLAGLTHLPAIVRDTDDTGLLKEAVIENIHRVQLNPLEEAAAYQQLLDDLDATHDELAQRLGKSRPTITNTLRLLALPPGVQRKVAAGVLSAGHAKAVLALDSRQAQEELASRIVAEGLSVRSTEEIVRLRYLDNDGADSGQPPGSRGTPRKGSSGSRLQAPGLADLEERLSDALMARVRVRVGTHRGKISIEFASVDDLERIVDVIARGLNTDITVVERPLGDPGMR